MYSLKEKDLMPGTECEFEATGETKDEVNEKMLEHAKQAHADTFSQMTPEQSQQTMQRADELLSSQE